MMIFRIRKIFNKMMRNKFNRMSKKLVMRIRMRNLMIMKNLSRKTKISHIRKNQLHLPYYDLFD